MIPLSEAKGFLHRMGLIGWQEIEPVIIGSLVANKAVLLDGNHGSAKTMICSVITESFLGGKGKFRYLNAPNATTDEMAGILDISSLSKNKKISYIETPVSIWGGNGILIDEINRAFPGTANKLLELALSGTYMGMDTGIVFRFGAVNPPGEYITNPMDMALVSRFSTIKVPDLTSIFSMYGEEGVRAVLTSKVSARNFQTNWKEIKAVILNEEKMEVIDEIATKVSTMLATFDRMKFSGRQAFDVREIFIGYFKFYQFTGETWTEEKVVNDLTQIVMSKIPEVSRLVDMAQMIEPALVETKIKETIKGVLANIQALMSKKKLDKLISEDKIAPEGMEKYLDTVSPDSWKAIRGSIKKTASWKRLNNFLGAISVSNHNINSIPNILDEVERYKI